MVDEALGPEKSPVEVHSIMINEGAVEISYAEDHDVSRASGVMTVRTIMIPRVLVEEEMAELLDAAQNLVDAGLVAARAPASSFRRPR